MQLEDPSQARIELGNKSQSLVLADFQVRMAMETQNLQLDRPLVEKAIDYFYSAQQEHSLGMYLVKIRQGRVIGCLLLTFENEKSWWIQSVYVIEEERKKGHFTSLFQQAVRLGKEKNVMSIRLYAENDNDKAKNTYFRLGMSIIEEKMYSYDFVYGNFCIENESNHYKIEKIDRSNALKEWVQSKTNILTGNKYKENDWNHTYSLKKEGNLCSIMKLFTEFSDWRFGLIWYIREIYTSDKEMDSYQAMIQDVISMIVKQSTPKAAAIRVLFRENLNLSLKGGQLDHYEVLEIKL